MNEQLYLVTLANRQTLILPEKYKQSILDKGGKVEKIDEDRTKLLSIVLTACYEDELK